MMKIIFSFLLIFLGSFFLEASEKNSVQLNVLQFNIWQEGTIVEGGFEAIADEIVHTDSDVVFFSEVRNYNNTNFIQRILESLDSRGHKYYGKRSKLDVGIISKYPLSGQEEIYPVDGGCGSILRAALNVGKRKIAVYSAHLDYKDYACYLPRGYNGKTWKKMEKPVLNPDSILKANREAFREEGIKHFIHRAKKDIDKGYVVILGGDFNEPSHLDWTEETKQLWDHNGVVVRWDCSMMLLENGFKDSYRIVYPNPVTHPGFTFPSDNKGVPVEKLTWAPGTDERDRIDFIYYYSDKRIKPVEAFILGPSKSIVRSKRMEENTGDEFVSPLNVWPSDHKGVLVKFHIK